MMFVRLATETDTEAYVELARQAAAESSRHVGFNPDKVRAAFQSYIETACPTIFVVDDRSTIIGFLNATINEYNFADGFFTTQEIIWVRPDKRGTRAAVLLVREFLRWSDSLGATENTGGNDNGLFTEKTVRLLEAHGFERVGVFVRRVRQDTADGQEIRRQRGGTGARGRTGTSGAHPDRHLAD